jgi:2-dehydro-3-deoxyphosphogluconate aldolase/(4S)-4-hydroxy-2-oxoglutarate aldolase
MDKQSIIQEQIISQGLLPLFYHNNKSVCLSVLQALYDAGVRVMEFTNRGAHALENFKAILEQREKSMPGLIVAIGTIKTPEDAHRFIEAGADALVSPTFDAGVCDVAYMHKTLWIPGCMTPTEIQKAEDAGCSLIKLFPGNILRPSYIPSIRPLFPKLKFLVTGGVGTSNENLSEWFNAGASCVGIGSKLITDKLLEDGNYSSITNKTKEVLHHIQTIKKTAAHE